MNRLLFTRSLSLALALCAGPVLAQSGSVVEGKGMGRMPLTEAEKAQVAEQRSGSSRAYKQALQSLMPLTPSQIRDFKSEVNKRQEALRGAPSPTARPQTQRVKVGPGAVPPTVTVSPRYGGAITVLDATGKPWPVTSVTVGDPEAFEVNKPIEKGPGSSMLTVVPLVAYGHSNAILTLKQLPTPIIVRLETEPNINNGRTDLIIAARGPNAVAPVATRMLASPDNEVMRYLLDGVPPASARRVEITGGPAQAWIVDNSFYLRTRLSVLSPAWIASVSGSGSVTVYQLPIVPTVNATDTDGATVTLKLPESALIDGALAQRSTTLGSMHYGPSIYNGGK